MTKCITALFIILSSFVVFTCLANSITAPTSNSTPQPQGAAPKIAPYQAQYTIFRKSDPLGTGVRELSYLDNNLAKYSYQSAIKWFIYSDKRTETSIIKLNNFTVTPTHYTFDRKSTTRDRKYQWKYDTENRLAQNIEANKTLTIDFPEGIQDKLSYHLQHRLALIENPTKKTFTYPVISTSGGIKNYTYQFDKKEELTVPFGTIKTIRLKREVKDKNKITYVWFAPELNYLLVKLKQEKDGSEQFEVQLNKLTTN